jgi:hypothetical protein
VANATTRLQPVVMLTGQAAGLLAATAVRMKTNARKVPVRTLQQSLLASGTYLMPYNDVKPGHPHFIAIQRVGATGILKRIPTPHQWANQTWFHPDSSVRVQELRSGLQPYYGEVLLNAAGKDLSVAEALALVRSLKGSTGGAIYRQLAGSPWRQQERITKAEMAALVDECLKPFNRKVDLLGNLVK